MIFDKDVLHESWFVSTGTFTIAVVRRWNVALFACFITSISWLAIHGIYLVRPVATMTPYFGVFRLWFLRSSE